MRLGGIEQTGEAYKVTYTKPALETSRTNIIEGVSLEGNNVTITLSALRTEYHINPQLAELLMHHAISRHPSAHKTFQEIFKTGNITSIEKNQLNLDFMKDYENARENELTIKKKGGLFKYIRQ